jgi:hypothetical protein
LFELFAWIVLCRSTVDSSSDGLLLDHRVTTFDFDMCSQHRSEPTAEAALLQSAFNAPDAPLATVILMKAATRQRRDAAAMRCDGDAMRRRCDATAMQQRCYCDATAQMTIRINRRESGAETGANPAQKPAQYVKVFPPKIQKDSNT